MLYKVYKLQALVSSGNQFAYHFMAKMIVNLLMKPVNKTFCVAFYVQVALNVCRFLIFHRLCFLLSTMRFVSDATYTLSSDQDHARDAYRAHTNPNRIVS